jgi:ectoine hydroxylase-related dioxygenase (phytanoyl-CoA dioxygenase family)
MAYLNAPVEIVDYDEGAFPFRQLVREHLNVYDLSRLHELIQVEGVFKRENDQSTWAHRRFYEIGEGFLDTYRSFIREFAEPLFGEELVYQRMPSFRVHLPDNLAVGEFHRDADYNHMPAAVNLWIPLTPTWGNNSVWIEQDDEMTAPSLAPGQALLFDGVGLYHGNKLNDTGKTRVSFDIRVVPRSKFVPSGKKSVNTGVSMDIGGYYETLDAVPAPALENATT